MRDFFLGATTAEALAQELDHSVVAAGPDEWDHPIEPMGQQFEITPEHLLRVCTAVTEGLLRPHWLQPIGFCLLASDSFCWDSDTEAGARVAEVVHDWSAPEVNLPLTVKNAARWRRELLGQNTEEPNE